MLKKKELEKAGGNKIKQIYDLVEGIDQSICKKLIADVKSSKIKVQVKINGNELRVDGKKKDDLQSVIQLIESSNQEQVFIKTDSKLVQLNLSEVLWVEALGNYIRVYTEKDKFTVLSTMKEIESKLPSKDFIRVQRSFIVRIDKVQAIEDNYIIINDKEIHIGKSFKEEFNKRINFL